MKISNQPINQKIAFGSDNHPIDPFEINTSQGKLFVKEFKFQEINRSKKDVCAMSKMFVDNSIDGSIDPNWKRLAEPACKKKYDSQVVKCMNFIRELLKNDDGNSTVLLARDSQNSIKAGLIANSFDEFEGKIDSKTLYLDSLAVDSKYRHNNVGTILLNKPIESSKGAFTDAVLTAYNKAKPMYEKLGFQELDLTNPKIRAISEVMEEINPEIPKYVTVMSKPLTENTSRWWQRVFKQLFKR